MRYTDVIWDFNGTLLDDADAGLACVEELLRRRGLPPLGSLARYREVFRFPIRDYYTDIGFDFSREPWPTSGRCSMTNWPPPRRCARACRRR